MGTVRDRITALREWMARQGIDAFIVPSNDPHFSEYVAPRFRCREWLTGFTGSAGTAVVTRTDAALWTDSRYYLQAAQELNGSGITLKKAGLPQTEIISDWLKCQLPDKGDKGKVAVDGRLFSHVEYESLNKTLSPPELAVTPDPFYEIWADRPAMPDCSAFVLDESFNGESAASKIERLKPADSILLVTALDDVAWLYNIRGSDIRYNPLVMAYAALEPGRSLLFADRSKFKDNHLMELTVSGIELHPYAEWDKYLASITSPVTVSPAKIDAASWNVLSGNRVQIMPEDTTYGRISAAKAIKNETETKGFRRAMAEDGVAIARLWMWIEAQLAKGITVTEMDISRRIGELRSTWKGYRGESFECIAAYGPHGAIVHYEPAPESNAVIGTDNFLLIDTGGQYLYGTTDITRTIHFGEPSAVQKKDYTNVLKGMIDLSAAAFPVRTRGAQLDILARRYLLADSSNYLHGTGHGVGHFLCVHEGPQSIRMNENPVTLRPGMVQSCEPGVYREGAYGVRVENLLLARDKQNGYMDFETLTLAPVDTAAIDIKSLNRAQIEWLNNYHGEVYDIISPYLEKAECQWLRGRTAVLDV